MGRLPAVPWWFFRRSSGTTRGTNGNASVPNLTVGDEMAVAMSEHMNDQFREWTKPDVVYEVLVKLRDAAKVVIFDEFITADDRLALLNAVQLANTVIVSHEELAKCKSPAT